VDWFKFLESAGPYSAPLSVVLLGGLVWLSKDRTRILAALDDATADRIKVRDLRTADLERSTREFTAQAITLGEVVREFNGKVDAVLARLR
jgi:hypothetical protein